MGIYAQNKHKQSLLNIIGSWVLSFLYMKSDKTSSEPPYTHKKWKDKKTVMFVYCAKNLEDKCNSISKKEANKTQVLHIILGEEGMKSTVNLCGGAISAIHLQLQ